MACSAESGTCLECVSYCTHKPGWFLPGEAEKVAEFLGVTLEELFHDKLSVDWWQGHPNTFVLSPAVVGGDPGAEFDSDPHGKCVFLKADRCTIHPVKPHECAVQWCGAGHGTVHCDTAAAWEGHQEQITALLGREPEADFYDDEGFGAWLKSFSA